MHSHAARSQALLPAHWLILLLVCVASSSGCQKLRSKRRVDFAPFAEQTIASVTSLNADLGRQRRILTLRYAKQMAEIDAEAAVHLETLHGILEGMVDYSILVGRLSRKNVPQEERVAILATYIQDLRAKMVNDGSRLVLTNEEHEEILASVRAQVHLVDAMKEAQPIVNSAAEVAAYTTRELKRLLGEWEKGASAAIESDFEDIFRYRAEQENERAQLLGALSELYEYRQGDEGGMDRALATGAVRPDERSRFEPASSSSADSLEEHLVERLERLMTVSDRLRPEIEHYQDLQLEVDDMISGFDSELRAIWGVVFVWTRAHERMARGVVDPAEWFDVNDTPQAIFRLAGKIL